MFGNRLSRPAGADARAREGVLFLVLMLGVCGSAHSHDISYKGGNVAQGWAERGEPLVIGSRTVRATTAISVTGHWLFRDHLLVVGRFSMAKAATAYADYEQKNGFLAVGTQYTPVEEVSLFGFVGPSMTETSFCAEGCDRDDAQGTRLGIGVRTKYRAMEIHLMRLESDYSQASSSELGWTINFSRLMALTARYTLDDDDTSTYWIGPTMFFR